MHLAIIHLSLFLLFLIPAGPRSALSGEAWSHDRERKTAGQDDCFAADQHDLAASASFRVTFAGQDDRSVTMVDTLFAWLIEYCSGIEDWETGEDIIIMGEDEWKREHPGMAPVFEEYGLSGILIAGLTDISGKAISIEAYCTKDDGGAFGLYSVSREPESEFAGIGDEATLSDNYLNMWKNNCYFRLYSVDAGRDAMVKVACRLDEAVEGSGTRPRIIELLPDEEFVSELTSYFRGGYSLSLSHPFGPDDIAGFREGAAGDFGSYRLYVFDYLDNDSAQKALERIFQAMINSKRYNFAGNGCPVNFFEDKEGNRVTLHHSANYVMIFSGTDITRQPEIFEQIEDAIDNLGSDKL